MNTASVPVKDPMPLPAPSAGAASPATTAADGALFRLPWQNLLSVPVACGIGIGLHLAVMKNDPEPGPHSYTAFLCAIMGLSVLLVLVQNFSMPVRRWMADMHPIIAGAVGLLCVWEFMTSGVRWLPLPYFPSPGAVLRNLVLDWQL